MILYYYFYFKFNSFHTNIVVVINYDMTLRLYLQSCDFSNDEVLEFNIMLKFYNFSVETQIQMLDHFKHKHI